MGYPVLAKKVYKFLVGKKTEKNLGWELPPPNEYHLCSRQGTHANGLVSSIRINLILDAKEVSSLSMHFDWLSDIYPQFRAHVQMVQEAVKGPF